MFSGARRGSSSTMERRGPLAGLASIAGILAGIGVWGDAPAEEPPTPYRTLVEKAAARQNLSPRLVHAVIEVESSYRADAVSPRGAIGLMQLLPTTAARYGVTDLADPAQNVQAGTRHLRELLDALGQDIELALAAYNAGLGAVTRHRGIPPFPETRRYVLRVLRAYEAREPRRAPEYGFSLPSNQQYTFSIVRAGADTLRSGQEQEPHWSARPRAKTPIEPRRGDQRAEWSTRRGAEAARPDR